MEFQVSCELRHIGELLFEDLIFIKFLCLGDLLNLNTGRLPNG